ncbi:MAG: metal ABC transporter substrate-binding protein [Candidatus Nanopelagicales bacterium]
MRRALTLALALPLVTGPFLAACAGTSAGVDSVGSAAKPRVVAAFYPLQYAAAQVGGSAIDVTNLTQPGVEPHDLELSAQQVGQIADADLVLYIKGFQPAVDEAIAQQAPEKAIDVSAALSTLSLDGAADPHVWLDPANMAAIGSEISSRLAEISPANANSYSTNADALTSAMSALTSEYQAGLAVCRTKTMVVSHDAFGYLAQAFGLTQVGISGLSPEAEPSPARIKDVADIVATEGVTTIYYETLVDPKVAQTLAEETGATAAMLDPLEGLAADSTGDYASVMRENLATLITGQGCA